MGGGVDPAERSEQLALDAATEEHGAEAVQPVEQPTPSTPRATPHATPLTPAAGTPEAGLTAAAPDAAAPSPEASPADADVIASRDAGTWLDATCPYLRSADGTWRSVVPQRGQRCWGQTPPALLEPAIQERLCRNESHTLCEIFVAAEQRHLDALARDHVAPERLDGRFGVLVRPSTLVLDDPAQARVQVPAAIPNTRNTRVALGLTLAGGVVIVALLAGLGSGAAPAPTPPIIAFASPSPAALTISPATSAPLPSASQAPPSPAPPTPVVTPEPTARPTPKPTPQHSPGIRTTYRVKKGDTLAGIAAKYGVTTKQIRAVNDFGNPPHLRYGTLLNIPFP